MMEKLEKLKEIIEEKDLKYWFTFSKVTDENCGVVSIRLHHITRYAYKELLGSLMMCPYTKVLNTKTTSAGSHYTERTWDKVEFKFDKNEEEFCINNDAVNHEGEIKMKDLYALFSDR